MQFAQHDDVETPHGNSIVWRYMSMVKFLDLVAHQRLFFTNAKNLTDEYEVSIPDNLIQDKRRSLKEKGISGRELEEEIASFRYSNSPMRDLTLINCWSIGRNESYALWKIYLGGSSAGIAIRTTFGQLRRAVKQGDNDFVEDIYAGKVKYQNYIPNSELSRFNIITTKKEFYEYEKECRLFILHYPTSEGGSEPPYKVSIGRYVKVDLDEMVDELYLSPFAPSWFGDTVEKVVKKVAPELSDRLKTSSIRDQ